MKRGWFGESYRHYLSAKGVRNSYNAGKEFIGGTVREKKVRLGDIIGFSQQAAKERQARAVIGAQPLLRRAENVVEEAKYGLTPAERVQAAQRAEEAGYKRSIQASLRQLQYQNEVEDALGLQRGEIEILLNNPTLLENTDQIPNVYENSLKVSPEQARELLERRLQVVDANYRRLTGGVPGGRTTVPDELVREEYVRRTGYDPEVNPEDYQEFSDEFKTMYKSNYRTAVKRAETEATIYSQWLDDLGAEPRSTVLSVRARHARPIPVKSEHFEGVIRPTTEREFRRKFVKGAKELEKQEKKYVAPEGEKE